MSYPASGNAEIRQLTRRVRKLVKQVAYAASITPAPNQYDILEIGTLTGNVTVNNPTGALTDGQEFVVRFTQDGPGARTVTWGAGYAFSTQAPANGVLTTANSKSEIRFRYHAGTGKHRSVSVNSGY